MDRGRLRALIESAPNARLVLVAAPAGFGKSTLLRGWTHEADVRSAWLALEPRDDDVVRFAGYLGAAVEQLAGRADAVAPHDPSQVFDPELALARVLVPLSGAVEEGPADGVVLVLDDYHVIGAPAIHELVARLVERLPPRARLVIATRADPPLPLARLRARGELIEVRAEDLRFTASEADELLRSSSVDLEPAEVEELAARTEGWAAALRLAAISLRGRSDQGELVRRFGASHRFVLDYVVEEVLAGLAPETQDFLLQTSILDRLCGSLCEAVTGRPDGQDRLEELERANLLIIPLDDERHWYRYHALFAEVLRARLGISSPGEVAGLHARASAWHAERGDDEEAIAHGLRSGDLERTCRMVEQASLQRLHAGELSTVRRWLDGLPPEVVRGHAQLSASYAWCLALAGETRGVEARLEDAEAALETEDDPLVDAILRTQVALLRSRLADLNGDSATAVAQARLARGLVPTGLSREVETTLRGDAVVLLARALAAAGETDLAAATYREALPDLHAGGNIFAAGRAIADLAAIAIARGDPAEAVRLCEEEAGRAAAESTIVSASVVSALARARLELGQADLAETAARRALELAVRTGDAPSARSAEVTLARIGELREGAARTAAAGPRTRLSAGPNGMVESLTPRELEVLGLVALGRSNAQIAVELFVSVGTVKSHVHAISGKLGAANRVEAVARGRELGLLG